MAKVAISTENAPKPVAAYSPGSRKGNILQVAGQVGIDPKTGKEAGATVGEQARQAFANVSAVLEAAGSSFDDVVMVRVYLTDTDHFAEFNEVYNQLAQEPYPARTTVYVGLPAGHLVEIDALAVLD
ncbi:Rid family detoxifying hydrolase [Amycolatopsis acidiphila]|uniref:RidA family protein n=1 Tax=Amycolatopsis acidiphila TaxID=715473 RepID=A0A557ZMS8_9PSEU|nr:Rid family detoxifying hydrolase [Amycolatopsis acidiphila]TVT13334.1 RidA family protein [Amycolatopsis acidiphila]UIJ62260.1 Rid family detoxifying hydrolase [Amycolatopsis acidiphila]GHG92952.1 reactive intermediate/imine deaminase [Amycolatopsis acidiphila]